MINKSKKINILGLMLAALGFVLINANVQELHAQQGRDPFQKPGYATPKTANPNPNPNPNPNAPVKTPGTKPVEKVKIGPSPVGIPAIQDRINYFKRIREQAVINNQPLPKVTSVLTLDEMSVMGIVRTPRGFAAMIQATPINLNYTIYPGEKFFNGQLVAIEDNKLVFRKVVKMSDGKFIASEENKTLRQYSQQEEIQGTAPTDPAKTETAKTTETTQTTPAPVQQSSNPPSGDPKTAPVTAIVSPLDEMNKPAETPKTAKGNSTKDKKGKVSSSATKKGAKKPVKVAENKEQ
jgi:hypothetical protein